MEKSHHAAKAAYHRHTQHSGGQKIRSPLLQVFEHWYEIIQHRFRNQNLQDTNEFDHVTDVDVVLQARRERSIHSSASAHHSVWRATCIREGSRWVPQVNSQEPIVNSEELDVDSHELAEGSLDLEDPALAFQDLAEDFLNFEDPPLNLQDLLINFEDS